MRRPRRGRWRRRDKWASRAHQHGRCAASRAPANPRGCVWVSIVPTCPCLVRRCGGRHLAKQEGTCMRKLLAISLAVAAACGGTQSFQDQARDAMPDSNGVRMGAPSDNQAGSTNLTVQNQGQQDLAVVEAVTNTPPTSCTESSCTWGPGSNALDPNTYQLSVSKNADGVSFDWHLDAQSKAAAAGSPFVTILHGNAIPSGIRHRGSGTFTIDLDAAATLNNHSTDHGSIEIAYSNVGPAHITARFKGVNDSSPNHAGDRGNAYYDFREQVSGGGDMEIAWHNLNTNERTDIHSRWLSNGSGRADVTDLVTSG